MKQVHSFSPNFRLVCDLGESCAATYINYESFRSHVYKKHKDVVNPNTSNRELPATTNLSHASESDSESHPTLQQYEVDAYDPSLEEQTDEDQDEITRAVALFILRIMEVHKTSQVSILQPNGVVLINWRLSVRKVAFNR